MGRMPPICMERVPSVWSESRAARYVSPYNDLITASPGITCAAAIRQRDQAIYNQVIAEALQFGTSDTPLAAQLTLAAYRLQPTPDLASRLLNTENTPA
jgi:hypothetical protein